MASVLDTINRPLRNLRISVTDKCNLRCDYCMPEDEYVWLDRKDLLTFEEITELASIFAGLGVNKVRLTGGEPLMRRDLDRLVRLLGRDPRIRDLALTTNAVLLGRYAGSLKEAGLHRITVSLDTLRSDRFRALTRRDSLGEVLTGISAAVDAGFTNLKINAVVIRGYNDDELTDLIEFGSKLGAEVRFIEYMDVGGATRWRTDNVVSRGEMLKLLAAHFGPIRPMEENGSAPAERYVLKDGRIFGIIASTTEPFCRTCDRARLTADGVWFLCLYARHGVDLKRLLRHGASQDEIAARIKEVWQGRADRGAEQRISLEHRAPLFRLEELRRDPHREMHTRGG